MDINDREEFVDELELWDEEVVATKEAERLVDKEKLTITRSLNYGLKFDAEAIKVVVNAVFALLDIIITVRIFGSFDVFRAVEIFAHSKDIGVFSIVRDLEKHLLK